MIHLSCLHECRVHYFKIDPVATAAAAAAADDTRSQASSVSAALC